MLATSTLVCFVPTLDAEKAKLFYGATLGLELVADNGFALIFKTAAAHLRIVRAPPFTPQPFTIAGWEVAALADTVRSLAAKGIAFERYPWFEQDALGIWHTPSGDQVAWFKDPDGNTLSLSQSAGLKPNG